MDPFLEEEIRRELAPGEQLLWNGIPQQGLRFRPADAALIPFSLMWGGFAIFWEYSVLHRQRGANAAPGFFVIWGIPFVVMGLYMIIGRFFVDAWIRSRTILAVTNRRVLIRTKIANAQIRSLDLKNLGEVTLQESAGGRGTITFGPTLPNSWLMAPGWPGTGRRLGPVNTLAQPR
jgi:hypothetical protein